MFRSLLLLPLLGLCPWAAAQPRWLKPPDIRGLQIFPGRANAGFTGITRLTFGKEVDGEALMEVPVSHFLGIGDRSQAGGTPVCSIDGMTVCFVDHDASTSETYGLVIRPRAAGGGPNMTATAIVQLNGLSSPKAVGTRGWCVQTFFLSGSKIVPKAIPCRATFYFGMQVAADRQWPKDGISLYYSHYAAAANPPTDSGDFPRASAPGLLWSVTKGKAPTNDPRKLGFRGLTMPFSLIPSGPVLQCGAGHLFNGKTHPGFGAAGLYPDVKRKPTGDGLVLRITDNQNRKTGGNALLFMSLGATGAPPTIIGISGRVYLSSSTFLFLVAAPLTKGSADSLFVLAKAGQIPTGVAGATAYFQAVTSGTGAPQPAITNLVAVKL